MNFPILEKNFEIVEVDLGLASHQAGVIAMMDAYASDPMGDGQPLSPFAREHLIQGLREHPTTLIFLVFHQNAPCGIATCFRGFSTFAARPLLNVSDFYVVPKYRGQGIGRALLESIEAKAISMGCCKLTLEVQSNNSVARQIYEQFGFRKAVYAADAGSPNSSSLYMIKPIGMEATLPTKSK